MIFVYDGAPAHRNPTIPAPNTELKMLPSYSPFLNIVEQAISSLKAAIKADMISRPEIQRVMDNRDEARARRIPLGDFRTQQLLEALHRNIDTVTAAKCAQWYRLMQTYLPNPQNQRSLKQYWKISLLFALMWPELTFGGIYLTPETENCL